MQDDTPHKSMNVDQLEADFGFDTIPANEKTGRVAEVFHSVATRYDLMNDLMSGGIHRFWKQRLVRALNPLPTRHLLDVAGGTGDIATAYLKAGGGRASLVDINASMVKAGIARRLDQGILPNSPELALDYIIGNAEQLPVRSASMDSYVIAFGLRNVTHIDAALQEAKRVLKPGGQFFCLEFSKVSLPILAELYDRYSFNLLPKLGGWVTGDAESYRYLVESIRRFPDQAQLTERLHQAGFKKIRHTNYSFGIVALHQAWRLD